MRTIKTRGYVVEYETIILSIQPVRREKEASNKRH